MRQSKLFTKTRKSVSKDEQSLNAQLLERGGFVYKNFAGVYSYLPLGYRVLQKIIGIMREEMNAIGGQEVLLGSLQDPEIWKKTKRWEAKDMDIWFRTELAGGAILGLANTHEEPLTEIMSHYAASYKDFPVYVYQFQTKFRNELRAKSGLMRVREFIMKDLYSFSRTQEELDEFYEKCASAYLKIFKRVGIGGKTYRTFASGGAFSKFSDEFQTESAAGEDTIYLDRKKRIAVNKEVYKDDVLKELGLKKDSLEEIKGIEVGNIFKLGTKYSEPLDLFFTDEGGKKKPVIMGSYGIGPGRVMGAVVELCNDDKGIVWPVAIAPFQVNLLSFSKAKGDTVNKEAEKIYASLLSEGIEVLYDDRDASPGEKFADADLIGIPYRAVVSERTKGKIEVKKRNETEARTMSLKELFKVLNSKSKIPSSK